MKQVAILILCALIHFSTSTSPIAELKEASPIAELKGDYCLIDHGANIAKLEDISDQLNGLITNLKKELDCEKLGRELNPVSSCKNVPLASGSGEYWIKPGCGEYPFLAYCDMETRYDGKSQGWMRVANLDMTDPHQECPDGFRFVNRSTAPRRTCGRSVSAGCESVIYPVNGTKYSKVCGRVRAYQVASPDAFDQFGWYRGLDRFYVDGVSITHGAPPRTHIWTLAASWTNTNRNNGCPCATSDYRGRVPSFVGNDYFCETGHRNEWRANTFYPDNALWDGIGCGGTSTCCTFNNPPYFCKDLPRPTTEDIEVRLCGDQGASDEDTPIEAIEIYVY